MPEPIQLLAEVTGGEHRPVFETMVELVQKYHNGMTPHQILNFVLNDVEFPTEWGKFDQAKRELVHRYDELVHLAFELRRTELKAQLKEQKAQCTTDPIEAELHRLSAEELRLRLQGIRSRLAAVIRESLVFFDIYHKYKHFDELPPQEQAQLEAHQWHKKCQNMPLVFEERYGDRYMHEALGSSYERFVALRRSGFGLLPREVTKAAQGQLALPLMDVPHKQEALASPMSNGGGKPCRCDTTSSPER